MNTKSNVISTTGMNDLHSEFFKKSHRIVFSQLALTPVEHDIFALFLTKLSKEQWDSYLDNRTPDSPQYQFCSDVLCDWFHIEKKYLYSTLRDPARRLSGKSIGVMDEGKQRFKFRSLFKEVRYEDGVLTITPNDLLINEYLCISQGHSQVPHKTFRFIEKEHAKRLYTMLCRFKEDNHTLHPQSIEDLHAFFGLLDDKGKLLKKTYAVTGNLVNRIIKPSILEIAEKEPHLQFEVDEKTGNYGFTFIKKGRKVTAIKFLFKWNQKVNKQEEQERRKLGYQLSPLEWAYETYAKIQAISASDDMSVSFSKDELDNLMFHTATLVERGKEFTTDFMLKYSMANTKAISQM